MTDKIDKKDFSPTRRTGGFTLIELLVVIMIIAILTAIGLAVGSKVMTAAAKKRTVANMKLIMHAVNIYQEEVGDISSSPIDGNVLLNILHYKESPVPANLADLIDPDYVLDIWDAKIKPIIEKLPEKAFQDTDGDGVAEGFVDGFENPLWFEPTGGLGGTPRLISAGPDGLFGSVKNVDDDWVKFGTEIWGTSASEEEKREEAAEDDIHSDK
jgi:prepilin-type N-terminal cleavage/methylation domain-containing protein